MKGKAWILVGVLAGIVAAFLSNDFALDNLKFHLRGPGAFQKELLEQTVRLFNKNYAGFFDTGGPTVELNAFPADNLVKRRIFQDINLLLARSELLVHDLHKTEFTRIALPTRLSAVVETKELWDMWVKNLETDQRSASMARGYQFRYYLRPGPGRWEIWDFEVYGLDTVLPPSRIER